VGQAQKEFTHNESLQTLDALVGGGVEEPPRATPPASPVVGASYIVAEGASDTWAGKAQSVATWTSGGWRFIAPVEGVSLYERSSGTIAAFRNGAWEFGIVRGASLLIGGLQVVGPRAAAIGSPTGGSVVDAEGRAAIEAILGTLRQHGLIDA
ncbi:MAG TPA: DUF2793 domain-containing protein, partial [Sphingomicrobium sp.]